MSSGKRAPRAWLWDGRKNSSNKLGSNPKHPEFGVGVIHRTTHRGGRAERIIRGDLLRMAAGLPLRP